MRIAFISVMAATPWGGSEELWYHTVLKALESGYEVLVSVIRWNVLPRQIGLLAEKGAKIQYRENPFGKIESKGLLRRLGDKVKKEIPPYIVEYRQIVDFSPDHIFISQGGTFDIVSFKKLPDLVLKFKCTLICQGNTELQIPPSGHLSAIRKAFSSAANIVFVSSRNLEHAKLQTCLDLENALVIPNTLPNSVAEFNIRSKAGNAGDNVNMAVVGRLECNHKGQHLLLKILSQNIWKKRPWHLNIYGEGRDEAYLKELTKFLKLESRVTFCGHVTDRQDIWEQNDILLLPSFFEGTPLVLIEAMYYSRPAVVNDVGGNAEISEDGKHCFVSKHANIRGFSKTLNKAWKKRDRWNEMGKNARAAIEQHIQTNPSKKLLALVDG